MMIENAIQFLHIRVDVWSGDRLIRRRSSVQTPQDGAKISAFSVHIPVGARKYSYLVLVHHRII